MDHVVSATVLANMEGERVSPHVLGRLDLVIIVLAGALIITAMWDWFRGR